MHDALKRKPCDTNRKDVFARNVTNKVQYLEYIDSWKQGSRKMVKGCAHTTEHSFVVNRAGLLLCPRERVKGRFTTQHTTKSLVARSFFTDKPAVFGLEGFSGPSWHLTSYTASLIFSGFTLRKAVRHAHKKLTALAWQGRQGTKFLRKTVHFRAGRWGTASGGAATEEEVWKSNGVIISPSNLTFISACQAHHWPHRSHCMSHSRACPW